MRSMEPPSRGTLWRAGSLVVLALLTSKSLGQNAEATGGAGLPAGQPAGTPQESAVQQDNIVIVLDASGSMEGQMAGQRQTKMDAAKQALREVLRQVPPTTNVGLLVFSGANVPEDWVYPLGHVNRLRLEQAIDEPRPGGGTPLGAYLKKGADRLLKQRQAQHGYGTFRLLVVTDGEASDPRLVEAYLPDVLSRGLTVDVIGVDMQSDHALATRVHSYRRANDPASLKQAVADVFAEVSSARQGSTADSQADQDSFAIIAPLPSEMAARMLDALTSAGNYPIGEQPPSRAPAAETESGSADARHDAGGPQGVAPVAQHDNKDGGSWAVFVAVAVIMAIYGLVRASSGKSTRANRRRLS